MPEISRFYGISAKMYYDEHNPPHFHAEYGDMKALVNIQTATVMTGALPNRQLKLVLAWCEIHKNELMRNWDLAKDNQTLSYIAPLK